MKQLFRTFVATIVLFALVAFTTTASALDYGYSSDVIYAKVTGTNNVVAGGSSSNLTTRPIQLKANAPTLAVQASAAAAAANSGNLIFTFKQSVNGKDFVSAFTVTNTLAGNTTNSTIWTGAVPAGARYIQLTSVTNSGPAAGFVTNLHVTYGYFY